MILRNYDNALNAFLAYGTVPKILKDINGLSQDAYAPYASNLTALVWGNNLPLKQSYNSTECGVVLGTGDKEPTYEDHCLSGEIISGLTYTKNVQRSADGVLSSTMTYTITNENTESVTIREVGYLAYMRSGANSSNACQILLERSVLATPITIAAGGVAQLTYHVSAPVPQRHST